MTNTQTVALPVNCITPTALHALARKMDTLGSFHKDRGGAADDAPCLTEIVVEGSTVFARVVSGAVRFRLQLVNGEWDFR